MPRSTPPPARCRRRCCRRWKCTVPCSPAGHAFRRGRQGYAGPRVLPQPDGRAPGKNLVVHPAVQRQHHLQPASTSPSKRFSLRCATATAMTSASTSYGYQILPNEKITRSPTTSITSTCSASVHHGYPRQLGRRWSSSQSSDSDRQRCGNSSSRHLCPRR